MDFMKVYVQIKEFNDLTRKLKNSHPSYFDEFKYYRQEIFPFDQPSENELRMEYYLMAFKILKRKEQMTEEEINFILEKCKMVINF
jgi:hypothetical protein